MVATLNYELKDAPAELFDKCRWSLLTMFILHANVRNRCWPSMRGLAHRLDMSLPYITQAKQWLIEHEAIKLVPFKERVDDEKELSNHHHVYQLTGYVKFGDVKIQYLYINPDRGNDQPDETSKPGKGKRRETSKPTSMINSVNDQRGSPLSIPIEESTKPKEIPLAQAPSADASGVAPGAPEPVRAVAPEAKRESAEAMKKESTDDYWRTSFFQSDDAITLDILRQLQDGQARTLAGISFLAPRFYRCDSDYLKRMVAEGLLAAVFPQSYRITEKGRALLPANPLPPGKVLAAAAQKPKAPRKPQPHDALIDAVATHLFGASDRASINAVAGRAAKIVHGDKNGVQCCGLIAYECERQNRARDELDYNQLAEDVGRFDKWRRHAYPDIKEVKDCVKVMDYWQRFRNAAPKERTIRHNWETGQYEKRNEETGQWEPYQP